MKYLHIVRLLGAVLLTLTSLGIAQAQVTTTDVEATIQFDRLPVQLGKTFEDAAGNVHTKDTLFEASVTGDLNGRLVIISSSVIDEDDDGPIYGSATITTDAGVFEGRFAGQSTDGCNTARLVAHGTGELAGQTLHATVEEVGDCEGESATYSLVGTIHYPQG